MIEIRRVRGDDPQARSMLAAMEAWIADHLGPADSRTSTVAPDEMVPPNGAFVVVSSGGRPVAGGGVRRLSEGIGEIKRMFVLPEARGQGHARRLLEALEDAARDLGFRRVRLDTAASMTTAMALYRRAGYREIPDYNGNVYAAFWGEKELG